MVGIGIDIYLHLSFAAIAIFLIGVGAFSYLLKDDRTETGNKLILGKPDPHILSLGFILLLAAFFEGGMFDWSGLYFKEVVGEEIFTTGYLIFMASMAISRFVSDSIIPKIGTKGMFNVSAFLIVTGFGLAVIFPTFWIALIGFMLVGFGTASVVPMIFILAGTSKKYSPGMAISIIATYAMVGMLGGPPIIGYIAHVFSLKVSFVLMGLMGLVIIPISKYFHGLDENIR
ncbi:MAG: MFS transporter [Bacteroidetes bacterium]|nr:MFS transporter [Bacteroidota bacterium]